MNKDLQAIQRLMEDCRRDILRLHEKLNKIEEIHIVHLRVLRAKDEDIEATLHRRADAVGARVSKVEGKVWAALFFGLTALMGIVAAMIRIN